MQKSGLAEGGFSGTKAKSIDQLVGGKKVEKHMKLQFKPFNWFQNAAGKIIWDDSQEQTIKRDGEVYTNIGTGLTLETVSFIDEDNDIGIRGVEGAKYSSTVKITGHYNNDGTFNSFTTDFDEWVGYTFGHFKGAKPWGEKDFGLWLGNDGSRNFEFHRHTEVNKIEKPGLWAMGAGVVDVNQKVSISISPTGELQVDLGHGVFPSLEMQIWGSDGNVGSAEYKFTEHSFILSHMGDEIEGWVNRDVSIEENKENAETNSPMINFSGYTSEGNGFLFYKHFPENPKEGK